MANKSDPGLTRAEQVITEDEDTEKGIRHPPREGPKGPPTEPKENEASRGTSIPPPQPE